MPPPGTPLPKIDLSRIAVGVQIAQRKIGKDSKDSLEEETLPAKRYKAVTETIVQSNHDRRANRILRTRYASYVFKFLVGYSGFCASVVLLNGFHAFGFALADGVVSTLVGSTAVSAIGLVATVVAGLFPTLRRE